MSQIEKNNTPTMLVILDGFGHSQNKEGNAIARAQMPTWQHLIANYPSTLLSASGVAVGLPDGYIGNSEVGHLCIGAGRTIKTAFCKFNDHIADKSFFKNKLLIQKFTQLKESKYPLHLIGLLSDAGVHSHQDHLYALITLAKQVGVEKIYVHAFLDGRDTPPRSAQTYLEKLETICSQNSHCSIASIHGRFYAMDRDNNWDRIQKTYTVLCTPSTANTHDWHTVIEQSYAQNISDEFVEPVNLDPKGIIKDGDGIVFFNFRPDRARQLAACFLTPDVAQFQIQKITPAFFVSTTRYQEIFDNDVLFEEEPITHTLLDEIATQTHKNVFIIAETEKYAHVTYFFRGKRDIQLPTETRVLIPSIKAKTYIDYPEMSASQITEKLLESLKTNQAYFYLVNYANGDMVGHSGDLQATIQACECLDTQIAKLYEQVVEKQNGTLFITADHGNAEEMIDLHTGKIKTAHTTNPVPFVMANKCLKSKHIPFPMPKTGESISIANIAPTILLSLNLKIPLQMEQKTIF